jgi:type II secretory pathway component PulJ
LNIKAPAGTTLGKWKGVFVCGRVEKCGSFAWDVIWSPWSTDWTWSYMGFGQNRSEQRMGLTPQVDRQLECAQFSSKDSGNGHQDHMDARSCKWMDVIIKYDMADNVGYNRDRRRRNQERRTTPTAHSEKKSTQATVKPTAETSVTCSTAWKGTKRNRNKRSTAPLGV